MGAVNATSGQFSFGVAFGGTVGIILGCWGNFLVLVYLLVQPYLT